MDQVRQVTNEYRSMQWAERIKERNESGQTVRAWCSSHGINEKSYYYWQRRLRERACEAIKKHTDRNVPTFAEISIRKPEPQCRPAITVLINGTKVEIHNGAEQTTIECVIRIINEQC